MYFETAMIAKNNNSCLYSKSFKQLVGIDFSRKFETSEEYNFTDQNKVIFASGSTFDEIHTMIYQI